LLCLFSLFAGFTWGQQTGQGQIVGRVTDSSGAVVTGAAVTITEVATGFSRSTTTGESGQFVFPSLRPTQYEIAAEAAGFRAFRQTGVQLDASQSLTLNIELQVGAVTETVDVVGNAIQVNTTTSELSEVVDQSRIIELPLNGRDAAKLATLVNGTVLRAVSAESAKAIPGALELSANGTPDGLQTSYKLDGANNTDIYFQRNNTFPFPDALQEFSIQTSNYSATTGGNAGAMVNVVTRSGTNEFHGGAFEFVRNREFNARNFFAKDVDRLKRNQFGAFVGGPIIPNKMFFFFGWQQSQLRDVRTAQTAFAPTVDMKDGNFATCGSSCDKAKITDPLSGEPFANKQVPVSRFDPAAVNVANHIPDVGGDGFTTIPRPLNQHSNQFITRVDYMLTDNDRLSGRYFIDHFQNAGTFDPANLLSYRGQTLASRVRNQNAVLGWQKTFGPTVLNDFQFSYAKNHASRGPYFEGVPSMQELGVRLPIYPTLPSISQIEARGFFTIGDNLEAKFPRDSFTWANRTSVIVGNHSMQFGGDWAFQRVGIINEFRRAGHFLFTSEVTGFAMTDFFLGTIGTFDQGTGEYKDFRANRVSAYFQDDWKVTRRLTINLGARYEPTAPWKEIKGRFMKFRLEDWQKGVRTSQFTNAPAGITYPGDPGVPEYGTNPDYNNWAARFGFAYALTADGKTSLRGGGGMFYDVQQLGEFGNNAVNAPPFSLRLSVVQPDGPFSDPYQGRDDFDKITVDAIGSRDAPFPRPVLAATFDDRFETPLQYNWNLTLEREIFTDWLARAGYVGSASNYGRRAFQFNPARYIPGKDASGNEISSTRNTDSRRLFAPELGNLEYYTEDRRSNYHSLQLSLQKRFSRGLTFRANYTWAKAMGNYHPEVVPWFADGAIDRLQYGPLDIDRRNRLVLSWVWELPTVRSENFLVKFLINGWEWSGIGTYETGTPFEVTSGQDNSRDGIGDDRAKLTGASIEPAAGADKRVWFAADAFARNDVGTFGAIGPNALHGPSLYSYDMGLFKRFTITERINVQFRAEFFNTFNQVNFANPNANVSGGGFGTISSTHSFAGDPRILQFGLKLQF
jgi:hypothetical protein